MREPRPWLAASKRSLESKLLSNALDEPLPNGALLRAGKRIGVSAAALSASSAALAQATAGSTAASATTAVSTTLMASFGKAIAVGIGAGALMVGAARWTARHDSAPAVQAPAQSAQVQPRPQSPAATARPSAPTPPLAPIAESATRTPVATATRGNQIALAAPAAPDAPRDDDLPRETARPMATALARFADEAEPVTTPPKQSAVPSVSEATANAPNTPRSTLAREVKALDIVRGALRDGDARRALDELNHGERQGVFQLLSQEAGVLRVQALGALGRTKEASALARQLVARGVSPAQKQALERWIDSTEQ